MEDNFSMKTAYVQQVLESKIEAEIVRFLLRLRATRVYSSIIH